MPRPMWRHKCAKDGSFFWIGTPTCPTCQQPGQYDGWQPTMHEAMAQYQTFYRLKPVGFHRRMSDDVFAPVRTTCKACRGNGVRAALDGRHWHVCMNCRGLGSVFTRPADEIEMLRKQVLAAYPDAAANPVPNIFAEPVALSEASGEIISLSKHDVVSVVPPPQDVSQLDAVWKLAADSSPLDALRLWQPTDKADQYLRCFLLDFGHRVLAAERKRAGAG